MLTRNRFVTNSSSTAFIAWGIVMPPSYVSDDDYFDLMDLSITTGVSFDGSDHDYRYVMYANESRVKTEEFYGIISMVDAPPEKEIWKQQILKVCKRFGIRLDDSVQFGWFFYNSH
jgi:hypothetical protein